MNIAVNTRFLIKNKLEGIGWFTYESLKRITQNHPEHQFHFLFDRKFDDEFIFSSNITPHIVSPQARHPFLWYLWFEWSVPRALKKTKADLFLSTDGYCSLSTSVKQLTVIHDLAFEHFPNHIDALTLKYYKYYTPKFAHKANRIATVSSFSKNDIAQLYNVPNDKIDVVYNGANKAFQKINEQQKKEIREKFSSGFPYFIYAGAIQPRKNVHTLFKAFDLFKEKYKTNHKLIIAGRFAWKTEEIKMVYENLKYRDEVIFTNHLGRNELALLMGAAEALMYVSLFEGFGIPIIESFQCEVPVITSNVSSMPEVAGKGALIVDPYNISEICEAMNTINSNIELRNNLLLKAKEQLLLFSWDNTASKLWKSIEKVL